jgi:hypothetical protein
MIPLKPNFQLIDAIQKNTLSGKKPESRSFKSFFGQYYLYATNFLSKEVKSPVNEFWTQWHDYLLISHDPEAIIDYVREKETSKPRSNYSHLKKYMEESCSGMFYSENVSIEDFGLVSAEAKKILSIENKKMIYSYSDNENQRAFNILFLKPSQ